MSRKVSSTATFIPLRPATAYLLGLIYGDGSICKTGHGFRLFSGDADVLAHANNILNSTCTIDHRAGKMGTLRVNSRRLCTQLKAFGLVPDKAHRLRYPRLPADLEPHFVRGLLDSDGCWALKPSNNGEALMFSYVSICKAFVVELRKRIRKYVVVSRKVHVIAPAIRRTGLCKASIVRQSYRLTYSHHDSVAVGEWLYESDGGYSCARKKAVWLGMRHRVTRSLSPRQIIAAANRYTSGESIRAIAKSIGRDESGFRKILLSRGITLRPHGDANHKLSHEQRQEVVTKYETGVSPQDLAKEYAWDVSSVHKFLKKHLHCPST